MPDASLIVLGAGSLVLGYVWYNAYYNETSQDANDPDPTTGVSSTNTSDVVPGRHPNPRLRLGVRKLRERKGNNAWANAASEVFYP